MNVSTFFEFGLKLIKLFAEFFQTASRPISELDIPAWIRPLIFGVYPTLMDFSLIEIMFGTGLTLFVVLTIVKWIVGVLPLV